MKESNEGRGATPDPTPLEELAVVVAKLRFSAQHADYKETETWSLFAHPWPAERAGFDALITIKPRAKSRQDLAGHRIVLRGKEGTYLPAEPTNRHGQIWFKDLPEGEYRAEFVRERTARLSGPVVPAERRIEARLRRDDAGNAVLELRTAAVDLGEREIDYRIGDEGGTVPLTPDASGTHWSASVRLEMPPREAKRRLADLVVEPRSRENS